MNLVDTVTGGVIFGLASMASLQIHGSSLRASGGLEERRAQDAGMDLLLAQVQRQLEQQAREALLAAAVPADQRCEERATVLQESIAASLPATGSGGATVLLSAEGALLKAMVQAPDLPLRRRWFSPAAYGLCGNPSGAPPPGDALPPQTDAGTPTDAPARGDPQGAAVSPSADPLQTAHAPAP
jgi:hypothetical protein